MMFVFLMTGALEDLGLAVEFGYKFLPDEGMTYKEILIFFLKKKQELYVTKLIFIKYIHITSSMTIPIPLYKTKWIL